MDGTIKEVEVSVEPKGKCGVGRLNRTGILDHVILTKARSPVNFPSDRFSVLSHRDSAGFPLHSDKSGAAMTLCDLPFPLSRESISAKTSSERPFVNPGGMKYHA